MRPPTWVRERELAELTARRRLMRLATENRRRLLLAYALVVTLYVVVFLVIRGGAR